MQTWAISFVLVFALTQLYQWMQGVTLPLPFFIFAGALLAIASNSDKLPRLRRQADLPTSPSVPLPDPPVVLPPQIAASSKNPFLAGSPQLPMFSTPEQPESIERSISFSIQPLAPTESQKLSS